MKAVINIRNLLFFYLILFILISGAQLFILKQNNNIFLILVSLSSSTVSLLIVWFMFQPTKIQGTDRIYVVAPDLRIIKEELILKTLIPEESECQECNHLVYKPFLCPDCNKLLCGQHFLKTFHECKRIISTY